MRAAYARIASSLIGTDGLTAQHIALVFDHWGWAVGKVRRCYRGGRYSHELVWDEGRRDHMLAMEMYLPDGSDGVGCDAGTRTVVKQDGGRMEGDDTGVAGGGE